jgi:hypothetical protein
MQTIRLNLERLEDRVVPAIGPSTPWHFTPAANFAFGAYNAPGDPGSAGFNLVYVNSPSQLALIPAGDKALVDMGPMTNGVDSNFLNAIRPYIGNPKVFGFYLADEPNPAVVPASNLKAESDWIHANDPGAKTFIVLYGDYQGYTPSNTDIDLVGLDPYPIRTWGVDYSTIPAAVIATERLGWSRDQIVPVYQAFGDAGTFVVPTAEQEQEILAIWGMLTPNPAFDYAYSWGEWGAKSLVDFPDLQAVFMVHNTNTPPNPGALMGYGLDRLQVDLFTRLATVQPLFARAAQQAHAALEANPYNGTAFGSMVATRVDQLFASWEALL